MEKKQRNIRRKRAVDELEQEQEEEDQVITAEDIKLLQRQRQRRTGTDAAALALAAKEPVAQDEGAAVAGPAVLEAGFKRERQRVVEEEDPHMKKYIEEQLAQRMGKQRAEEGAAGSRPLPTDLDALMPETIKPRQVDTELGPSWVAGITEVPLTVEQKLQNIEETEAAKKRILARSMALMTQGAGLGEEEGPGGPTGARRTEFPVRFGKLDPEEERRIAANRAKKAEQREYHYKQRVEKKERNARAPAWL